LANGNEVRGAKLFVSFLVTTNFNQAPGWSDSMQRHFLIREEVPEVAEESSRVDVATAHFKRDKPDRVLAECFFGSLECI